MFSYENPTFSGQRVSPKYAHINACCEGANIMRLEVGSPLRLADDLKLEMKWCGAEIF
jgi:hypothetical protein